MNELLFVDIWSWLGGFFAGLLVVVIILRLYLWILKKYEKWKFRRSANESLIVKKSNNTEFERGKIIFKEVDEMIKKVARNVGAAGHGQQKGVLGRKKKL